MTLALLVLSADCRRGATPEASPDAPPPVATGPCSGGAPEPDTARSMPYDCAGLAPRRAPDTDVPAGLSALVHATLLLPSIAASHFGVRDYRADLESAVILGEQLDAGALSEQERVLAQSGALAAWAALGEDAKEPFTRRARALVSKLAMPASALTAMGTDPLPNLDAWLGPRSTWCEEDLNGATSFHGTVYRSTLLFRAVHAGDLRAIFGQVVAVDTAGKPHATPLVLHAEVARGHGGDARACVLEADPAAMRGGAPAGLVTRSAKDLSPSHFVDPSGGRCGGCHTPGRRIGGDPVTELGEGAALTSIATGRDAGLGRLAELLAKGR